MSFNNHFFSLQRPSTPFSFFLILCSCFLKTSTHVTHLCSNCHSVHGSHMRNSRSCSHRFPRGDKQTAISHTHRYPLHSSCPCTLSGKPTIPPASGNGLNSPWIPDTYRCKSLTRQHRCRCWYRASQRIRSLLLNNLLLHSLAHK